MKFFRTLILINLACFSVLVQAEEEELPAKSLVELLELVKEGKVVNSKVNSDREKQFLADRARQAGEVRKAERWQAEEEAEEVAEADDDDEDDALSLASSIGFETADLPSDEECSASPTGTAGEHGRQQDTLQPGHRL